MEANGKKNYFIEIKLRKHLGSFIPYSLIESEDFHYSPIRKTLKMKSCR